MKLFIGDIWMGLEQALVSSLREELVQRVLRQCNFVVDAQALVDWMMQHRPEFYQRVGFSANDATQLIEGRAQRPFAVVDEVIAIIGVAKLGDLVYAAAAESAAASGAVRVEEVYELALFGEIAEFRQLRAMVPPLGPGVAVMARSLYVDVSGDSKTVEMRPQVRQRRQRDTWAELELPERRRIWLIALEDNLAVRAGVTNKLLLFPRLGSEFLDSPALDINPDDTAVTEPQIEGYAVFGFPEIAGQLFLMRIGFPPAAGEPPPTNWPEQYEFQAGLGDILMWGPSYPSDVAVRIGQEESAWTLSGEVLVARRSDDLRDDLQRAVQAPQFAATDDAVDDGAGRELVITATSRTDGRLELAFEAELEAVVSEFAGATRGHQVMFTPGQHAAEVPLQVPLAGQPWSAQVTLDGRMSRSVIRAEIGAAEPRSGDDKIGVRLVDGVAYTQPFEVTAAFALSAVELRLSGARAGTRLRVEVLTSDSRSIVEATLDELGRVPHWQLMSLDVAVPVEPEVTYQLRVTVADGAAVWHCGAGNARHALRRSQGDRQVKAVVDVNDSGPLAGQVRLRSGEAVAQPALQLMVMPGEHLVSLSAIEVAEDGSFTARADLLPALQARAEVLAGTVDIADAGQVILHLSAQAEGTIDLSGLDIRYLLTLSAEAEDYVR
ncbi:MAG: hypothetical protein AAGC55_04660 [Myxococcota bacterium]